MKATWKTKGEGNKGEKCTREVTHVKEKASSIGPRGKAGAVKEEGSVERNVQKKKRDR